MEPDFEDLKQTFQRYDNEKLIRIATKDADGLRPEAVQALREVIAERGLSEGIAKGIEVQRQPIDREKLMTYAEMIRKLPCPVCGATDTKLNGTVTGTVISFIIITNYTKRLTIACPSCLDKKNDSGTTKSAVLGWWGIPWGLIRTIQCLDFNSGMKRQNHLDAPNDTLLAFTLSNIGKIEAHRNDNGRLRELITSAD